MKYLLLILSLLPLYAVANEKPFKIRNHDGFYKSVEAACAGFDYSKIQQPIVLINPTYAGSYTALQNTNSYLCQYNFSYHPYSNPDQPIRQGGPSSGAVVVDTMPACVAGTESTYTWPLGRRDSSAEFNIAPGTAISPPAFACIDGCKAQHQSVSSCFNESETDGSITYCDYNAKLTGETCTTSENQPPRFPSQPTQVTAEQIPAMAAPIRVMVVLTQATAAPIRVMVEPQAMAAPTPATVALIQVTVALTQVTAAPTPATVVRTQVTAAPTQVAATVTAVAPRVLPAISPWPALAMPFNAPFSTRKSAPGAMP
ncbi:hypothetical protein [Pseudomonas peli]|uniref:hypothetical protein n=1 Tax=Pseudomonas peli TaxID=592361 RepID=UPI0024ADFE9B|nr:hypothetical protein [Pseudomonas peli]